MSKVERSRIYSDFLREEGYVPQIDKDGDVIFKVEGGTYLIILDDEDDMFFRLVYPSFWPIKSQNEKTKVEKAALEATSRTKVAKVFPIGDNVWATLELFCAPPEAVKPVFSRALSALRSVVNAFAEEMRK